MDVIIGQAVERLAGEQALRSSEQYYRSILHNSSDGITVIDRAGVTRWANATGYTMFGYERGEADAMDGRLMLHPDDREGVTNSLRETFAKGASTNECRIRRKDGTWAYCEVRGRRIVDFQGQPVAVFNSRDISDSKAAERAILEAQAQLRARLEQQRAVAQLGQDALRATELAPLLDGVVELVARTLGLEYCGVAQLQSDGKEMLLRAAFGAQPGKVPEMAISTAPNSRSGAALLSEQPVIVEDTASDPRILGSPLLTGRGIVSSITTRVGSVSKPFGVISALGKSARKFSEDDANFIQAIANIIAQAVTRLDSEQALRARDAYFQTIINSSSDQISVLKPDGSIAFTTSNSLHDYGRAAADLVGTTALEFIHPDDVGNAVRGRAEALEKGAAEWEMRVRDKNQSWRSNEVRGTRGLDPDGNTVIVISSRDISERKRAEQALLDAQDELRSRLDSSTRWPISAKPRCARPNFCRC